MIYQDIEEAVFLCRPNRFIAHIELSGGPRVCHVKNTGRCRELLIPGARVLVQRADRPSRKTKYDLISVYKGDRLINMDAAAPNRVFCEWVQSGGLFKNVTRIGRERRHGDSRFDFYIESDEKPAFVEVKGVTLEEGGVARFPDAPTERGVKHVRGLTRCVGEGYGAYAVFIIQMKDVRYMEPNWATHPAFGEALRDAGAAGVRIMALDCRVTEDSIAVRAPVEVRL